METITYLSEEAVTEENLVALAQTMGMKNVRLGGSWVQWRLSDGGLCTFERCYPARTGFEGQGLDDEERELVHARDIRTWYCIEHRVASFSCLTPLLQALLEQFSGWLFLHAIHQQNGFDRQRFKDFEEAYVRLMKGEH